MIRAPWKKLPDCQPRPEDFKAPCEASHQKHAIRQVVFLPKPGFVCLSGGVKHFLLGLFLISGWGVAAWLLVSNGPTPWTFSPPKHAGPSADQGTSGVFEKWSADPALAGALLGFCVLDEAGETVVSSPLAETALCPASALKTVTTGAALELLGPDFRFETTLSSSAPIGPDGILAGDLVLVGSGDPTLASEDLSVLVAAVVKAGLKQVDGTLRVDASIFQQAPVNDHWNWGDIGNAYGAGAYGVNVDHNCLSARFTTTAVEGVPAKLNSVGPVTRDTRWINRVLTGPAGSGDRVVVYSEPFGRTIALRGTVPAGESNFTVNGAIPDPPALALEILESRLKESGVILSTSKQSAAGPVSETDVAPEIILASHRSAALPEIIDHLHRVSDNLETECLFLSLGNRAKRDPSAAMRAYWESRGVAFTGLRMMDGSGLARTNMIRPLDLARINYAIRHGEYGARFQQSLSSYLDGNVRSKLGAMSGIKTEVGFLTMPDGREYTFALMANGLALDVDFWSVRENLLNAIRAAE